MEGRKALRLAFQASKGFVMGGLSPSLETRVGEEVVGVFPLSLVSVMVIVRGV
jgi:hypothetical protein